MAIWGSGSEWFWVFLQSVVLLVSALAIFWQVRLQRLANITSVLERLRTVWASSQMSEGRKALLVASSNHGTAVTRREESVLDFFEELGIYMKMGIVPKVLAWEFFSYEIEHYWPVSETFVREARASQGDHTYFNNAEYLYKEICKITKRKRGAPFVATKDKLAKFVSDELAEFSQGSPSNPTAPTIAP